MEFFATAPKGMTDLLAVELRDLGAPDVSETRGGVRFQGDLAVAYRACLWSRIATRILLPLTEFAAPSAEALYEGARGLDWSAHLDASRTLAIDAHVSSSAVTHSHYAALRIKDAIVDGFMASSGERPSVDTATPDIRVNCYLHRDQATLYLDLSGTSLHQRNYRLSAGEAPLKENLAAAILMRAGWPEIARAGGGFVDLMCGSGTLPIEAAMMAADIAPGLTRDFFGFSGWRQHDAAAWEALLIEARRRRDAGIKRMPTILGFDNNRRVLSMARDNAARAGLGGQISFKFQDLRRFRHSFPAHGLMVTNPPYGRRLMASGELPALYAALGRVLRENMQGWQAAVFTEDQALGKHVGIRADKLHSLYNGNIACKLIHFNIAPENFFDDRRLPRPVAPEALSEQARMFGNRLTKNLRQLRRQAAKEQVSCYRVYDADLPDFAAAIDVYQADDETWICVQEYEAPASIDADKARLRSRELVSVTRSTFEVDDDHLFYKTRARQRGEQQYTRLDNEKRFHRVMEGECRLLVNFEDYLDTGLFLDHRPMRLKIGREAKGKAFLNLFAYTGAATVHAAAGGATSTTSVDMSRTYLDWAARNLEENGLSGAQHQLVQADCLQWLGQQDEPRYDLIFLDPPTFSNSKRMEATLDVQRDHQALIDAAMGLLRPGGILYFSTNARKFKLDAALTSRYVVKDITAATIPFDFKRRGNIHQCWAIEAADD